MFSTQTRIALHAVLTIAGAATLALILAGTSLPVDYKPSDASTHLSEAMVANIGSTSSVSHELDLSRAEESCR